MNSVIMEYVQPSATIDSHHTAVSAFAMENAGDARDSRQKAIRLYYAVRDSIRYDPYLIELTVDGLKASHTLSIGRGWCVPKAILLAACCRAMGIPARLGFADVRNHLSTARMRATMKTDIGVSRRRLEKIVRFHFLSILGWSLTLGDFQQRIPLISWARLAPKGRIMSAQGIALGRHTIIHIEP